MPITTTLKLRFDGVAVQKGLKLIASSFKGLATAGVAAGRAILAPFAKVMAMLAPLLGFAAIAKLGIDATTAAAGMETLQVQFAALLKSESAAADLIQKMRKLNVESPLGLEDFAKGAKALLGVRMSAEDTLATLDKMSNISMGNADNFEGLVRAFAQVRSAGRLMGQEVLQFVNAGFNPLAEISQMTGESMKDLKKRMEDANISFAEVERAVKNATSAGGLFNGMNQKIAATTEGKIQKLKDTWNQLLVAFGTPINDKLRPILDTINEKIGTFMARAKDLGENVGKYMAGVFNSFGSGDFFGIVKNGLLAAVKIAGEEIIAVMAFAGNMMNNIIKKGLKEVLQSWEASSDFARRQGLSKSSALNPSSLTYEEARDTTRNLIGGRDSLDLFNKLIERNQERTFSADELRAKNPMAQRGAAAQAVSDYISQKQARQEFQGVSFYSDMVQILKSIDRRLQPQP